MMEFLVRIFFHIPPNIVLAKSREVGPRRGVLQTFVGLLQPPKPILGVGVVALVGVEFEGSSLVEFFELRVVEAGQLDLADAEEVEEGLCCRRCCREEDCEEEASHFFWLLRMPAWVRSLTLFLEAAALYVVYML